jgi:tyrosine-protein phosphatase SIW14
VASIKFCSFIVASIIAVTGLLPAYSQTVPQVSPLFSSPPTAETKQLLPNFGVVSPVLVRGAQPKPGGLEYLKKMGVKTIVNLRDGKGDIEAERKIADKLGLRFVSIPMSVFKTARKDQIDKFLTTVKTPENQPVYVHCRQGQDRCGTMVAAYRVAEESWTAQVAYQEMLKYGFHPIFIGLSASIFALSSTLGRPGGLPNPLYNIESQLKDAVTAL